MRDEGGPAVPELARRVTVSSCQRDPVRAFAPVLAAMPAAGIGLGDILSDSGYAHPDADAWAIPLRTATRDQAADHDLRPPERRVRPLRARPPHRRRPGRIPPRRLPRRHGQDPLPVPPRVDDPGPGPPRGWCRLIGLTPLMLFTATLLVEDPGHRPRRP